MAPNQSRKKEAGGLSEKSAIGYRRCRALQHHFSPDASKCEMASEAYSLTDGNWPVLYSAPPIPAGICRNPPEFTGMRLESTGILRNGMLENHLYMKYMY